MVVEFQTILPNQFTIGELITTNLKREKNQSGTTNILLHLNIVNFSG